MPTLAADVGGTFTDLVLIDEVRGRLLIDKVSSGARGSAAEIAAGISRITARAGLEPADVTLFVHGFTVATNALLTRSGARAVLLVSRGFGDILEIRNQLRPKLYALIQQRPPAVIPRDRVVEVAERVDAFGDVVAALDDAEIARVVDAVVAAAPEAVAISLLFSHLHPRHEQRLAVALRSRLAGVPVYASSDINPEIEEWPRASTTAMTAYVGPIVSRYIDQLEATLADLGQTAPVRLMRSDGGLATPRAARESPAQLLTSGLAGGVIAAEQLCHELGVADALTLDVGGTSADFAAIVDGTARWRSERLIGGEPLRLPAIDVETISNGGGSIAWIDDGGALRLGPRSAGAVPGPACYGGGGLEPTVTDAALVLGWLAAEDYLGGDVALDRQLAERAIDDHIARPLGLSRERAAHGILRVATAQLVNAMRALANARGLDPRVFAFVPFGGAGPLYASHIARELSIGEVIVPRYPGVFAATGLVAADLKHVAQRPFRRLLGDLGGGRTRCRLWPACRRRRPRTRCRRTAPSQRSVRRFADCRYHGQFHKLTVEVSPAIDTGGLAAAIHAAHLASYGHVDLAAAIELTDLRVEGRGAIDRPPAIASTALADGPAVAAGERLLMLDETTAMAAVPLFDRDSLLAGHAIDGPAVIRQRDSTVILLAGDHARVVAGGALRIVVAGGR